MRTVLTFIALLFFAAPSFGAASKALVHAKTVSIENIQFAPATTTVKQGEAVEWTNNDLVPHTVTSIEKSFDSKIIAAGAKWTFRAKAKGTFKYKCTVHPNMLGTLIVE